MKLTAGRKQFAEQNAHNFRGFEIAKWPDLKDDVQKPFKNMH